MVLRFCSWWSWPMTTMWPSANTCIIRQSWISKYVFCWYCWPVLVGFCMLHFILSWFTTFPSVVHVFGCDMHNLLKLACNRKLHFWLHCGCQWWGNLCGHLYALSHLLWHPSALPEESQLGRNEQSVIYPWLPHFCGGPILCALYFYVCETSLYLTHW